MLCAVSIFWIALTEDQYLYSIVDWFLFDLPFSMYCGWAAFLVVLSAFEVFGVDASTHPAGTPTKVSALLAILLLTTTAIILTALPKFSVGGPIAITWALYAISDHQSDEFIRLLALTFAFISALGAVIVVIIKILLS